MMKITGPERGSRGADLFGIPIGFLEAEILGESARLKRLGELIRCAGNFPIMLTPARDEWFEDGIISDEAGLPNAHALVEKELGRRTHSERGPTIYLYSRLQRPKPAKVLSSQSEKAPS